MNLRVQMHVLFQLSPYMKKDNLENHYLTIWWEWLVNFLHIENHPKIYRYFYGT